MTDRDAFLQQISEDPSDGARLIFADWLEEHGEPLNAEFIRVGCATREMEARETIKKLTGDYPKLHAENCRLGIPDWKTFTLIASLAQEQSRRLDWQTGRVTPIHVVFKMGKMAYILGELLSRRRAADRGMVDCHFKILATPLYNDDDEFIQFERLKFREKELEAMALYELRTQISAHIPRERAGQCLFGVDRGLITELDCDAVFLKWNTPIVCMWHPVHTIRVERLEMPYASDERMREFFPKDARKELPYLKKLVLKRFQIGEIAMDDVVYDFADKSAVNPTVASLGIYESARPSSRRQPARH